MSDDFPRRNRLDKMVPTERAIYDVVHAIEMMGADVRLSRAQMKLSEARDLVADFVDGVDRDEPPRCLHVAHGKPCTRYYEGAMAEREAAAKRIEAEHDLVKDTGMPSIGELCIYDLCAIAVRGTALQPNSKASDE